jgi:hypothetical protein
MRISRQNSKERSRRFKKTAKRLAAYSAAAAATVVTTQNRSANATDQTFDILDIRSSGAISVFLNLPNGTYGNTDNYAPGSFEIGNVYWYAPYGDSSGAFANPATCSTCGTGIGSGPDLNPAAFQVYPLPFTAAAVGAGQAFAARTYPGYGNYANDYYFQNPPRSDAIVGLQFTLSGQIHYGWIALSTVGTDYNVHGFGYNDAAGAPSVPDLTTADLVGDINRDGDVDLDDWVDLRDNIGADLSAETRADAYARGDIDHNGLNDIRDFDLFREGYDAANGEGSFDAMVAGVPEPSSIMLLAAGAAGLAMWRKKRAG